MIRSRSLPLLALVVVPATWRWPLPALLAWTSAWALFVALGHAGWPAGGVLVPPMLASVALAWPQHGWWRRIVVVAGFPLSALLAAPDLGVPHWAWLAALAPLALLYPLRAWSDAPWFPTPHDGLAGLERIVAPAPEHVLDAGCGLGHGLAALRRLWPRARIEGVECSWPLAWCARWRCRWARVRRADMWRISWAALDVVYLFQRPESMAQAWAKANAEMRPGRWLVSLEFAVPGVAPTARVQGADRRDVWVYRLGPPSAAAPQAAARGSTVGAAGR